MPIYSIGSVTPNIHKGNKNPRFVHGIVPILTRETNMHVLSTVLPCGNMVESVETTKAAG
jgi:hypothetical protein